IAQRISKQTCFQVEVPKGAAVGVPRAASGKFSGKVGSTLHWSSEGNCSGKEHGLEQPFASFFWRSRGLCCQHHEVLHIGLVRQDHQGNDIAMRAEIATRVEASF